MADASETARVIRDLLVIAKVAMPPKLFGEDPRVTRAIALLALLVPSSPGSRVPNASPRPAGFELAVLASRRVVEESKDGVAFIAELRWDLLEALRRAVTLVDIPLDPSDQVSFIAREWLTANGLLELPVENPG